MVNTQAINLLQNLFANPEEVFSDNHISRALQNNVNRYLHLKGMLFRENVAINAEFQRNYSYFYGLNRYMTQIQKQAYFAKFEAIKRQKGPIDVRLLTEEMQPLLGKFHFSFCSKMANMIDDTQHPIYDKNVANVFHRRGLGQGHEYKENIYQDLVDTYRTLKDHHIIESFKERFNAQDMGYMKVLDALFWVIGNENE